MYICIIKQPYMVTYITLTKNCYCDYHTMNLYNLYALLIKSFLAQQIIYSMEVALWASAILGPYY